MNIWIDADACPKVIKDFVFSSVTRLRTQVILVANSNMMIPLSTLISLVIVGKGPDEADRYIVEHARENDLVITADIPLASLLVDQSVLAINPRGMVYTEENVKDALATRNLMQDLRGGGLVSGGSAPFNQQDKISFANSFDREVTKLLRKGPSR